MNETCSEGCEDDIVTLLEVGLVVPKCQWYRGGRGIAIVVNVDNHLVERQVGSLCHRVYDAEVGLVWDNPIEVGVVQPTLPPRSAALGSSDNAKEASNFVGSALIAAKRLSAIFFA